MSTTLLAFTATLDKWGTDFLAKQDAIVKNIAIALAQNIVVGGPYSPGTPLDTSFARNSWYMSFDNPEATPIIPSGLDGSGQEALSQIGLLLVGAKAGGIIYLLNGAVYIRRLEYGWSQQAPSGMVRIALTNAQALVDGVIAAMKSEGVL